MTAYNTNLASEFYVLSMLHRLGCDASLSLGNFNANLAISQRLLAPLDFRRAAMIRVDDT